MEIIVYALLGLGAVLVAFWFFYCVKWVIALIHKDRDKMFSNVIKILILNVGIQTVVLILKTINITGNVTFPS